MAGIGKKKDKKKKRKFDYYEAFEAQAALAVKEAKLLKEVVDGFTTADRIEGVLPDAHAIEREADSVCHSVIEQLMPDFVTPIDREDIVSFTENLDEVIDKTEEIIQHFYMYDVHFMHEGAKEFADMIVRACEALCAAMAEFANCKKSDKIEGLIVQVNNVEDEADQLYMKLIRSLYTKECDNPLRVQVWTSIFYSMEECVDQCELVAGLMNMIRVKYA